jgi:hypothetical protein
MPKWTKGVLRSIGILNCAALLLGLSFLMDDTFRVLTGRVAKVNDAPYFTAAFAVMGFIQFAFATTFFASSIAFVRAKVSTANLYTTIAVLQLVYLVLVGQLWRDGGRFGRSVAAATGISDATTLFNFLLLVPYLYPLGSAIFVQFVRMRYAHAIAARGLDRRTSSIVVSVGCPTLSRSLRHWVGILTSHRVAATLTCSYHPRNGFATVIPKYFCPVFKSSDQIRSQPARSAAATIIPS